MRKGFQFDRLSTGELFNAGGSLLLASHVASGWHGRSVVLLVIANVTAILGLLAWLTCAMRRSPAVTLCVAVIEVPPLTVALIWLVVAAVCGSGGEAAKLWALFGAVLCAAGIYLSFRREDSPDADTPQEIETLNVSDLPVH